MAFLIDNSAVKSSAKRLEVIGNNVANVNTVGFKGSDFEDALASALNTETGIRATGGRQSFSQGDVSATNNPLDMAISGAGFFRVESGDRVAYTRGGQFNLNKDGEIVNSMGDKLTGFLADPASGLIKTGKPVPLTISQANDAPKPTAKATLELMLDTRANPIPAATAASVADKAAIAKASASQAAAVAAETAAAEAQTLAAARALDPNATAADRATADAAAVAAVAAATAATAAAAVDAPAGDAALKTVSDAAYAAFDPTDPTTYTHSTTTTVYTAQGKEVGVQTFYVKLADNSWDVYAWQGGTDKPAKLGGLTFDSKGQVQSSTVYDSATSTSTAATTKGEFGITIDNTKMALDLGSATQYGSKFTVRVSQDGRGVGQLLNYSVAEDGIITARYNNGNSKVLGQVVLANFRSLNGLHAVGNNQWLETSASGSAEINQPGVGVLGSLKASSTESANIDLTLEMIKMISAQRSFQAAAEMMRRQDETMQTVVNIGR